MEHNPIMSLRTLRASLTALLVSLVAVVGAGVPSPEPTEAASMSASWESAARHTDIQRLSHAQWLSLQAPAAAMPLLTDLVRGAHDEDVRERATALLLDTLTREPGCTAEGLDATLRYVYVSASDEQQSERAMLMLLARQVDDLPEGAQGAFIQAILPQVIRAARRHQLPPSVTLAQAVHESGWGRSRLARDHHNLFGVKAGRSKASVTMSTQEHQDGVDRRVRSRFRSFEGVEQSIEHHAELLSGDRRYAEARYHWSDWRAFLENLAPTYATDPAYAKRISRIVERYELDRWDDLVRAGAVQDAAINAGA